MGWLPVTQTQRWPAHDHSAGTGHVYQGRFKSFPVQTDEHFLTVNRHVERSALRANLCPRAEECPPSSVDHRQQQDTFAATVSSDWPVPGSRL
jgi:putative transposase